MKLILFICCLAGSFFFANGQACPPASPSIKPFDRQLNKGLVAEQTSSPRIIIRCARPYDSEPKPLVVIDGIPVDAKAINSLNAADIEAIHILKDSAATAIFGCRATNGVIVIVTKKPLHRSFIIKDAANLVGIPAATIRAELFHGNKSVSFRADELGRIETDSLKSTDYLFTISAEGYQSKSIGLKEILQNKGDIFLKKELRSQPFVQIETSALLYPNPVATGGVINVSFPDAKAGNYHIRVFNAVGQLTDYVQRPIIKGKTEQMKLSKAVLPGIYVVQISDETNHVLQTTKLLVK
jgi:TonB-dependent SusC/RagA subfamily outer membrane receptor